MPRGKKKDPHMAVFVELRADASGTVGVHPHTRTLLTRETLDGRLCLTIPQSTSDWPTGSYEVSVDALRLSDDLGDWLYQGSLVDREPLQDLPSVSGGPDSVSLEILGRMGLPVQCERHGDRVHIQNEHTTVVGFADEWRLPDNFEIPATAAKVLSLGLTQAQLDSGKFTAESGALRVETSATLIEPNSQRAEVAAYLTEQVTSGPTVKARKVAVSLRKVTGQVALEDLIYQVSGNKPSASVDAQELMRRCDAIKDECRIRYLEDWDLLIVGHVLAPGWVLVSLLHTEKKETEVLDQPSK